MASNLNDNLLLWLDLETSGSDSTKDCIIEIGCVLTTTDLEEIAEFESVVAPTAVGLGRMMMNPVVKPMHEKNGLLREIFAGNSLPVHDVTRDVIDWLMSNSAKVNKTVLAGSGVGHFDRRFIARYMPQLDSYLKYWCIDVGVLRRAHEMWAGEKLSNADEGKTHRALDDARCHLAEARAFKAHWQQRA